jgi:alpha-tubulin suppressor-like RCC1 family protein
MTQINKTAIVSQFETLLSNLTVSTEETEDLLVLLKTAINADVSANNIINELTTRIETANTSESIFELVHLVKSLDLITKNRDISVPTLSDLNNLTGLETGSIVFVESESEPYILMSNSQWETLLFTIIPAVENAYGWGRNAYGQLGDNTTTSYSSPISIVGGFTDWIQASAGGIHSLGLRANGTVWAWGRNGFGQLGNNTAGFSSYKSSPVLVSGDFTDWVKTSAGGNHNIGLRANGSLWSWGNNDSGELGINLSGFTQRRSSPVSIVGGITDWVDISTRNHFNLAIRANGTLWSWGNNGVGQLGDDTVANKSSPVPVVGGFTDWISASAGGVHSLGVRANGTLWAWGFNSSGRLGDNTTISRSSPVSVVGDFTDWIQASAGGDHSLGLRANGTLWAWGGNVLGRLGDNTTVSRSSPVSVVGGFTDWVQTSAGGFHSLGLRANGTLWAWGSNNQGRLGDNTTTNRTSPVQVVGGFSDWIQASAGSDHNIGISGG